MDKDEILKAAQENSDNNGEFEKSIAQKAVNYGALMGAIICIVLALLELYVAKNFDPGKPAILFGINGVASLYDGIKRDVRKKRIWGAVELTAAFAFIIFAIGVMFR